MRELKAEAAGSDLGMVSSAAGSPSPFESASPPLCSAECGRAAVWGAGAVGGPVVGPAEAAGAVWEAGTDEDCMAGVAQVSESCRI